MEQQLFKDVSEIHARLLDHKPVLQGHINYFVKEFEEKRGDHEISRLKKIEEEITEMKDGLIPESSTAMDFYLANITAKLKVATEVCRKIEEKENKIETEFLESERIKRKENWDQFMKVQYENCDRVDEEFTEQANLLSKHYSELEQKLKELESGNP